MLLSGTFRVCFILLWTLSIHTRYSSCLSSKQLCGGGFFCEFFFSLVEFLYILALFEFTG